MSFFRHQYTILVLLIALLTSSACKKQSDDIPSDPQTGVNLHNIAPDFTLPDQNGVERSLYDYQGKLVLIDFWASWCGFCSEENPELKKLYNTYRDSGFEILSVSLDTKRSSWINGINNQSLPFVHVSDLNGFSSPVAQTYKVGSIPHFVVVDEKGRIVMIATKARDVGNLLSGRFD